MVLVIAACIYLGVPYHLLYDGDGAFEDRGVFTAGKRFELDLGSVDISRPGRYSYTLRHLPQARFVAGLKLSEALPAIPPNGRPDAGQVALIIVGPDGKVVDEWSALADWQEANGLKFVDPGTIPLPSPSPGTHSHGTAFSAQRLEDYSVTFEVIVPFPATIGAELALQSEAG